MAKTSWTSSGERPTGGAQSGAACQKAGRQQRLKGGAAELEIVQDGELREDVAALGDVARGGVDHLPRRDTARAAAVGLDRAAHYGQQQSEHRLEQSRFAGTVGVRHLCLVGQLPRTGANLDRTLQRCGGVVNDQDLALT